MFTISLEIEFDAESAEQAVAMFVATVKDDYPLVFQVRDPDGLRTTFQRDDKP